MKEDKNKSFQDDIVHACIQFMDEDSIPDVDVRLIVVSIQSLSIILSTRLMSSFWSS